MAGTGLAAADEGAVRYADSERAISGSYIVVLKDGVSAAATTDAQARAYSATVRYRYGSVVRGYSATMGERQARRLAADPRVAYVEQDQTVSLLDTQTNPPSWGLDRVDQRDLSLNSAYTYLATAATVNAYVIDTGIRTTHSDFGGRAVWGTNTTGDGNNSDCHGHGTHVAGTIGGTAHGVAKGVRLTAVKVLGCNGSGTNSAVIAGIDWVTANAVRPAVANMSLGGNASAAIDDAVKRSITAGITYAVASGNNATDACGQSPARLGGANGPTLTVNASTKTDGKASFSNYGRCTDLFAPGSDITSAGKDSDTATRSLSGTSMAAPHVAGAAALYLAGNPTATPQQVKSGIVGNASSAKITSVSGDTPNRLLYTGQGAQQPPQPSPTPTPTPTPAPAPPWWCQWWCWR
ncbi:S8 family peptidase [Actinokineospora iranica]|uniref:S8 family peptidase n=1 Tax=Actinokineospora iranica TaxID=1271860 RepID=UPI001E39EF09|nr:S8 family peptidase [Actinokineospora iranica]